MIFVKADELKKGMRLAKPIYNKNGVMLYERDSRLTEQGIISIQNFGLIGIYVLEPAEPVPPMSAEDIEFERYQTMAVFAIKEILDAVSKQKPSEHSAALCDDGKADEFVREKPDRSGDSSSTA